MRPERRAGPRLALLALFALPPALVGCDADATVLLRRADAGSVPLDGRVPRDLDAAAPDEPDGSQSAAIEIHGSGFGAYAGRTIYGHIGPLSAVVVSARIAADGTFVLSFPRVLVILGRAHLDTYIDLDDDGDCRSSSDEVGGTSIHLEEAGSGYRVDVAEADLDPSLFGCASFN